MPITQNVTIHDAMPLELVECFYANGGSLMASHVRGVYWRDSIST
jgi:hypothetical protein